MFLRRCSGRFSLSGVTIRSVVESNNQLIRIMDNTANPQSEHGDSDPVTEETTSAQAQQQPQPERPVFDGLRDAMRKGAEDARTAAEKTIPKVKSAAADAVYWTAYGISFAVVFQWTFAKGLTPESLKSGVRDGVKAAEEAALKWTDKLRQRKEKATNAASGQADQSAGAVQPGAA
jgi:hypothetical protein